MEDNRALVDAGVEDILVIEFIRNLPYDFLDHILEGDDATGAAVLIHDHGEVHLHGLEIAQ